MKRMEVWADMACAWAYIGKRRLEQAKLGEDVEIVWRPYVIDPMAPVPSEPLEEELRDQVAEGITTSPTFVVGGTAVTGAQPPEVLADLVRHAVPRGELPDEVRWLRQAETLLGARDPLGALRTLRPLLADHGDDPAVRLLAARAYFGSAQLGRARETLEALLERTPGDHYARFLLGRTLERANRHPEALPHLRLAAAMSPEPDYVDAVDRVESRLTV